MSQYPNFGKAIQMRGDMLRKKGADVEKIFVEISRGATMRAIEAAQNKTPPVDDISGTNTRSSSLKEHWAIDSRIDPIGAGSSEYVTVLGNNMQYASHVDQGHRMDKHFVPGLVIDPVSGNLEKSPDGSGGIMVGTKTLYVPGVHMAQAGRDAFEQSAMDELNKVTKKVFAGDV